MFLLVLVALLAAPAAPSRGDRPRGAATSPSASSTTPPQPCQLIYDTHLECAGRRLQRLSSSLFPPQSSSPSSPLLWTSIDLSDNRFSHILAQDFQQIVWVSELLLENNRLKRIPKAIEELKHLTILKLKGNKIKNQQQQNGDVMDGNRRANDTDDDSAGSGPHGGGDHYEHIFHANPNLSYVDLGVNQLQVLPNFRHQSLDQLSLASNDIRELPSAVFPHLPALRVLSLAGNKISAIPGRAFQRLSRLKTLSLADNAIVHLNDDALWGLTSLEELYLGGNLFAHVPSPSVKLLSLTNLELDGNPIMAIGAEAFTSFPNVERLSLRSLQIIDDVTTRQLQLDSDAFCGLDRLGHVLLTDSYVQHIDYCLWKRMVGTNKFHLDLSGSLNPEANQLLCDCKIFRLLAAAAEGQGGSPRFKIDGDTCHGPERYHGYLAGDIFKDELEECPPLETCPAQCIPRHGTSPPDKVARTHAKSTLTTNSTKRQRQDAVVTTTPLPDTPEVTQWQEPISSSSHSQLALVPIIIMAAMGTTSWW